MFLPIIIFILYAILLIYSHITYKKIFRINKYHTKANVIPLINDASFNISYNLQKAMNEDPTNNSTMYMPIVNVDNPQLKSIIFMNNINNVILKQNRLVFNLAIVNESPDALYIFDTNDYIVNKGKLTETTLSVNIVAENFPKFFNNNYTTHDYFNFSDLDESEDKEDTVIKISKIVALRFDGKERKMYVFFNDPILQVISISYKSKAKMIAKIKETELLTHIYQWGIAGYRDSDISLIKYEEKTIVSTEEE